MPTMESSGAPTDTAVANWTRVQDKKTGKFYYWDKASNRTAWKAPPGFVAPEIVRKPDTCIIQTSTSPLRSAHSRTTKTSFPNAPISTSTSPTSRSVRSASPATQPSLVPAVNTERDTSPVFSTTRSSRARAPELGIGRRSSSPLKPVVSTTLAEQRRTVGAARLSRAEVATLVTPVGDSSDEDVYVDERGAGTATRYRASSSMAGAMPSTADPLFTKHRKGVMQRLLRVGAVLTEESLMSFQKRGLKKALLKKNREIDEVVIQAFKNIQSYMEDRKSSKAPPYHAQKLVIVALEGSATLRDELYLLVCKQVHNNPIMENACKGWDLIMILLAAFPPGPYSLNYLNKRIDAASNGEIMKRSRACRDRIAQICRHGPRRNPLSITEIIGISKFKPLELMVCFLDKSSRIFFIDVYTTVREFRRQIGLKCNLTFTAPFNLYLVERTGARVVLDGAGFVLDIISPILENGLRSKKTNPLSEKFHLEYRCEVVLPVDSNGLAGDPVAVQLMFAQAVADLLLITDLTTEITTDLAAYQLQASFGDAVSELSTTFVMAHIHEVTPAAVLAKLNAGSTQLMHDMISTKHMALVGMSPHNAMVEFLRLAERLAFYGSTQYSVQQRSGLSHPASILLFISAAGFRIVDSVDKLILESFPWSNVESHRLVVDSQVVVNVRRALDADPFAITIATSRANELTKLIDDYRNAVIKGIREIY